MIHLAGTPVNVQGRILQRCLICGCKLSDSEECLVLVDEDGNESHFVHTWPVGGMIEEVDGGAVCIDILETPEVNNTLKNFNKFCLELVEL